MNVKHRSLLLPGCALLLLATLRVVPPAYSADLGPADLTSDQMSKAFPAMGQKWKAVCGTHDQGKECDIELGQTELLVDGSYRVAYEQILLSESRDTFAAITRLAKVDPLYAGWQRYPNSNNIKFFKNTVVLFYKSKSGAPAVALFSFPENRISDWYGFANAMRLISLGARPRVLESK